MENEEPYMVPVDGLLRRYIAIEQTLMIQRWQCPPLRPAESKLQDDTISPAPGRTAVFAVAARCDLYTAENWLAMINSIYGGNEAAWFAAHNAIEANGPVIDIRGGK
jgi:hypothetical protein